MPATLTIVFRGLMVFHEDEENNRVEIGILIAATHVPRIMTIKNGVLHSTQLLQDDIEGRSRIWEFMPDRPIGDGPYLRKSGRNPINRQNHGAESDFRWIVDLESREFPYGDLTDMIDTRRLKTILYVPSGEFYTRLKSSNLNLVRPDGGKPPFGCIAAAIGCDISLEGDVVNLVDRQTGDNIFPFKVEPNTIYEFSNTPPDTDAHTEHHHHNFKEDVMSDDHFRHYYDLFLHPAEISMFSFEESASLGPPGPNPALCGEIFLGLRERPLD